MGMRHTELDENLLWELEPPQAEEDDEVPVDGDGNPLSLVQEDKDRNVAWYQSTKCQSLRLMQMMLLEPKQWTMLTPYEAEEAMARSYAAHVLRKEELDMKTSVLQ